jgi:amino acid adenylation domain-containing protein
VWLGDGEHRLFVTVHHLIHDGPSIYGVFLPELTALYEAFSAGKPSPFSELPIQYADYALWQRQWLQGEVLANHIAYWRKQLAGDLPVLQLPTDRLRPATQTYRGAIHRFTLPKSLTEALKALSRQQGSTFFMTLLAGFTALLHRYTGQDDIIVGTVSASRKRSEAEGLLGYFLNPLALRTDLSGNPAFGELLGRVRDVTVEALSHDDVPFEHLVKELQRDRDLSRNPIFQAVISLEPPMPSLNSGWNLTQSDVDTGVAYFDLYVGLDDLPNGTIGRVRYNRDLFDASTIARMLGHWQTVLESIVANPNQPVSRLRLLTERERLHLSSLGNVVHPENKFVRFEREEIAQPIPSRFEALVNKYPTRSAVKTAQYEWTYDVLNKVANRVARRLLTILGSQQKNIAILLDHDAPMIGAIIGSLKAGKTYVPLDPLYPFERISYMLRDSQTTALLTNNKKMDLAKKLAGDALPVINVDEITPTISADNICLPISPSTLAYILYTSGSTGQPKGVMQTHRNVLHFISNYTNDLRISADDRVTLIPSLSFDAAVMDIFGALLNGACLYPISLKEEVTTRLADWLARHQLTIYHSTPTVFRHLVSELPGKQDLTKIRLIILGGEEVHKSDFDLYKKHFSAESLFVNLAGQTESSVNLMYFLNQQTVLTRAAVPIGYPVKDTEVLLLDQDGKPTEIYGEIGIRSAHVAPGYWRNPELTRAAFLIDESKGNRRIYRTGDMGRLLPDGRIEFLGRKDFQVKIRGIRIELGEIEAVLMQHSAVREAVVMAREATSGGKQLVAYVLPKPKQPTTATELRSFLKTKLPDYMVPSAFVCLDALPLTPNGKVDRKALPVPDETRSGSENSFVAPRDHVERQLTKIWEEFLGIQAIGVKDNFFDLGGHSLLAMSILAKVEKTFGKSLPLATLFQAPTVEQLASILRQDGRSAPPSLVIPLQPKGSKPPFFCHGASLEMALPLGTDQPFYGLQPHGQDGREAPSTVEDMAADYIKEIRTIQPEGPYFLGGYSFGGIVAFEMAQQLQKQEQKVALLVLIDPASPSNDLFPPNASLAVNTTSFSYETYQHLHNLARLGTREKLSYVLERVRWRLDRINRKIKMVVCNFYLGIGRRVPASLRMFYFFEVSRQTNRKYVPQIYPGRIIFLKAEKSSIDWSKLATEGLEIQELPGRHLELLRDLHAQTVGEKLRSCLE